MQITFHKYHGCGNDFIVIDDRQNQFNLNDLQVIPKLCDRHFGIGADGLILLRNHQPFDFEMIYYNSDGSTSGLCGNGARCIVNFAKSLGIIEQKAHFVTNGKEYFADIVQDNVRLHVQNPIIEEINQDYSIINTGSRHIVIQTSDLQNIDIKKLGYEINSSEKYKQIGINVNYYEHIGDQIYLRTYERGVHNETLACGTGALATAISICISQKQFGNQRIDLITKGGLLRVELENNQNMISNVSLEGPGKFVYSGQINL